MTPNFIDALKERLERFLSLSWITRVHVRSADEKSGIPPHEDRDYSLREQQLYLWGSPLGPWY
ncbi:MULTISPECIES: hypothetical protein [unclassified Sinorhizobium]|uniref:hypothetical protein n=1 Tax=unclassified Sinorhizobium TaxID=2613772 RepID=UPI0035234222